MNAREARFVKVGQEIGWWVRSQEDPRWNCEGMAVINTGGGPPHTMVETLENMRVELGDPPADIDWGYS